MVKKREPVTNVMGTGLNLNERGEIINRQKVVIVPGADYGSDPLGDDMHRMVPSGDIVDGAERKRRLGR